MVFDLAFIWAGIIAFGVIMYVILDGFDLGIGVLSIFVKSDADRDLMISTIMPVWDGNETWLVFGGAALYGAFPRAVSEILPAAYLPIYIMVLALLFRGVAFEFRLKATWSKRIWDYAFFGGSLLAIIMQGELLAMFVQGFHLNLANHITPNVPWLNPFGLFCALALVIGYTLLAADWLIIKTVGNLQEFCYKVAGFCQYLLAFSALVVSLWSPFLAPEIFLKWFDPVYMPYLSIFPIITIYAVFRHWRAIKHKQENQPFKWAVLVFIMCYLGFAYSCYPYIVPRAITYTEAAAEHNSLLFLTIGAIFMLPALLYYTYYSYKVFRGKVTEKLEY